MLWGWMVLGGEGRLSATTGTFGNKAGGQSTPTPRCVGRTVTTAGLRQPSSEEPVCEVGSWLETGNLDFWTVLTIPGLMSVAPCA